MKLRSFTPSATQGALNAAAAFGRARSHNTERIAPVFCGTYDGAELRPCRDRPGAMKASALPSRRGGILRWPDGRLTDLHGAPAVETESAYTMPPSLPPLKSPSAHTPRTAAALCLRLPTTQPLKQTKRASAKHGSTK